MLKYFSIFFTSLFLGCSHQQPILNFNENQITQNKIYTSNFCTNSSYISNNFSSEYGNTFAEYINIEDNCSWNGLQRGYFEDLFKTTLKIKSFKVITRVDYENYEFNTYLIDNKYYLNMIYIYNYKEDTFIVDYEGKLSDKLIKKFNPEYKNHFINKPRFSSSYSNSLVKMNIINSYLSKERENFR